MKKAGRIATATVVAALAVLLLRGCVATSYLIPSSGMENALYRGERILVNKWSYGLRLPLMAWWGYHRWAERPVRAQDIVVFNNPANLDQPVIDRREVFIGRCVGLPGDTLMVDSLYNIVPSEKLAPDQKFLYAYPRQREHQLDSLLTLLSIRSDGVLGQDSAKNIRSFSRYEYYLLSEAIDGPVWLTPTVSEDSLHALRPIIVPSRGATLRVRPWNITLLRNTLVLHEGRQAEIKGDTLLVDGKPVNFCRFTKDYHWVAANNVTSVNDSRLFGFVPKDHLIGRAALVWFSKQEGTGPFDGYRWERIWTRIR